MAKRAVNWHGKIGHNKGVLRLYRSYNFVDKDPAIDKLRTLMKDERLDKKKLSILSGVSYAALDSWFDGDTKRPQHATLAAAATAMGYDWTLTQAKKLDYATELPKAQRWQEKRETERNQQKR